MDVRAGVGGQVKAMVEAGNRGGKVNEAAEEEAAALDHHGSEGETANEGSKEHLEHRWRLRQEARRERRAANLSAGRRAMRSTESISIPRKVRVREGPQTLAGAKGTPR